MNQPEQPIEALLDEVDARLLSLSKISPIPEQMYITPNKLERLSRELRQRIEREQEAIAILEPSMPESGLVDACKQLKQAYISEHDNAETADQIIAALRQQLEQQQQSEVEAALTELREMFPTVPHGLHIRDVCKRLDVDIFIDGVRRAEVTNSPNGLLEAMQKVRQWKRDMDADSNNQAAVELNDH